MSQSKNLLKENSSFQSEICVKNDVNTDRNKRKVNLDYDFVIEQFDELISELSCARNTNERTVCFNKNLTIGNEDFILNIQKLKDENVENCDKDISKNKKSLLCNHTSEVTAAAIEDKVPFAEIRMPISKTKPYVSDIMPQNKMLHENFIPGMKEGLPWINSHLWNPEKKKESPHFQMSDLEINKKILEGDLKRNFKGNYYNSSQFIVTNMPQAVNAFDVPYVLKQEKYFSDNKTSVNYNYKPFSYAESHLQEKRLCNPKLEFVKIKDCAFTSIPRSPKMSRSPVSKYISSNNCFLVKLYIETKDLHLGPFMFEIYPRMTLRLLKLKVEQEHGIVSSSQRWILGKYFAVDNEKSLADYNVLPGSSIIVYMDTEQKVSSNMSKNKVFSKKSTINYRETGKMYKSGSYNNLNITEKDIAGFARKDSLDLKLNESHSELDAENQRDVFNHNFENESINTSLIQQKNKSLIPKQKNMKENVGTKKKTEIVMHDKHDLPSFSNIKNSLLTMQNVNNLKKGVPDFASQAYGTDKNLSDSVPNESLFDNLSDKSHFIFVNQPENILIENDKANLIQFSEQFNNNSEKNKDSNRRTEINNYENINLGINYPEKQGQEEYETINQVNVKCENEVEMKNQHINVIDMTDKFVTEHREKFSQLNMFNAEKVTNVGNVSTKPDEKSKCKQSIASLIRKLSLTHKDRSVDKNICSEMETYNQVQNDKEKDENNFELFSQNRNQSMPSDIQLEILPYDPNSVPSKEEYIMQETVENLQINDTVHDEESVKNFQLLLEIENMDLVENTFNFICPVCFDEFESGQGIILHDCLHTFCRDCLTSAVCYADGALVKCPYRDEFYTCYSHLQQREIKALVSDEMYEKYLQRSVTTAEGLAERSFHCKTPDCKGWCIYDNAINVFHCPVCSHYNCLNCQAIHEGFNCRQYQEKLELQQKVDKESEKTLQLLNEMIKSGKGLRCPKCDLILLKKWGCDWLKCSVCKTEICWITKGPRWGPGGQGDTSGGCKCGVNGVKCHPSCTYCH